MVLLPASVCLQNNQYVKVIAMQIFAQVSDNKQTWRLDELEPYFRQKPDCRIVLMMRDIGLFLLNSSPCFNIIIYYYYSNNDRIVKAWQETTILGTPGRRAITQGPKMRFMSLELRMWRWEWE